MTNRHIRRKLPVVLLAVFMLTLLPERAQAIDVEAEQSKGLGIPEMESALPDPAREVLGDMTVADTVSYDSFFERLWESLKSKLTELLGRGMKNSVILLTVALLCSLAGAMYTDSVPDFIPLCAVAAVSAVAVGDVRSFIGMGVDTIRQLSDFSKALLPTLASAAAASGALTSASAKYVATALFIDVLLTAAVNILMPLIYAYIAVVIANAALGGDTLEAVAKLLKWLCVSILTILMLAFTAYLSISGIISGAADATVTRLAKTAISSALPVVGGIVSGAADTILAGAGMLRNTIGVFGMLAVIAICLTPFLTLGVQYLLYKFASGVAGALADKRLGGLISGMSSAFGIVLGLAGSGAFMIFISVISSMRAVTGG